MLASVGARAERRARGIAYRTFPFDHFNNDVQRCLVLSIQTGELSTIRKQFNQCRVVPIVFIIRFSQSGLKNLI